MIMLPFISTIMSFYYCPIRLNVTHWEAGELMGTRKTQTESISFAYDIKIHLNYYSEISLVSHHMV